MNYLTSTLAVAAVLLTLGAPARAQTKVNGPPLHISRCDPARNAQVHYAPAFYPVGPYYWNDIYGVRYYQPPFRTSDPTLNIDYSNATSSVMSRIEFGLLANGRLVAEVRDVGTFSPGAEIKHSFGLSRNVFPLRTGLPRCIPLRITFADGTVWRNPRLPALRRQLYATPRR